MFGLTNYLIAGTAALALAGGGYGYVQSKENDRLALELQNRTTELMSCGARLSNLVQDVESDNEIDRIPNELLNVVPDHWLLGTSAPAPD